MEFPANSENTLPELFTTGKPVTRDKIMAVQRHLESAAPQLDMCDLENICLRHYHAPGMYARELFIPEGMLIVGKIHKHAHHNNISLGKIAVATEFDSYVITAPHSFVSLPGTKRIVYALEDTIWTTYHAVDTSDIDEIESVVIASSYEEYDSYAAGLKQISVQDSTGG